MPLGWGGTRGQQTLPSPQPGVLARASQARAEQASAPAPPAATSPAPRNLLDHPQPPLPAPSHLSWAWQGAVLASATPDKPQTIALRAQTRLYKRAGCRKSLSIIEGEFAHVCHSLPVCQAVWVGKGLTVGPTAPGGPRSPLVPLAPAMPWKPCRDAEVRACLQPPASPAPVPLALTPSWTTGLRPDQTLWFAPSLRRPVPPTSELVQHPGQTPAPLPAGTDPALTPPGWVLGPPKGGVYGRGLPGTQQRPTQVGLWAPAGSGLPAWTSTQHGPPRKKVLPRTGGWPSLPAEVVSQAAGRGPGPRPQSGQLGTQIPSCRGSRRGWGLHQRCISVPPHPPPPDRVARCSPGGQRALTRWQGRDSEASRVPSWGRPHSVQPQGSTGRVGRRWCLPWGQGVPAGRQRPQGLSFPEGEGRQAGAGGSHPTHPPAPVPLPPCPPTVWADVPLPPARPPEGSGWGGDRGENPTRSFHRETLPAGFSPTFGPWRPTFPGAPWWPGWP